NSLGAFVEAQRTVSDYQLTKDEIETITGAIVKSKILEQKKEVVQDTFLLKLKVEFDVDQLSLQQALQNYQDRSRDRKTINHLIERIFRGLFGTNSLGINTLRSI
ncbi:MAG: hypothetical protein JRJ33_00840, partial [Deltaproteobacteria bacterium]|nr:hypothetical protein [Deltaproteobacteria bacterium]